MIGIATKFTGRDIPPNISEAERKFNTENLFNTICRAKKIKGFSHCIYDIQNEIVYICCEK